jgi:hypothetical protein
VDFGKLILPCTSLRRFKRGEAVPNPDLTDYENIKLDDDIRD